MSATAIPLENLSETGMPPKRRIKTADDARMIVDKVIEAGQERSRWNARIKAQIDGNPPFNNTKLKQAGQSWRTNINFMEAKSARSNALAPYYDLFSSSRYYFNFRTYYGSIDDREHWSGIVTEEFDCMLKKYEGFDPNIQWMIGDRTTFGRGFLIFEDAKDWFFKWKQQSRVFVPDGTEAYTGNQDVLVIRERARVHKLWNYIKDKKTATAAGWNVEAVVRAIKNATPEIAEQSSSGVNYELLQQQIADRDIVEGVRCETVPLAYVLTREFDGSITMQIVEEKDSNKRYADKVNAKGAILSQDFLYEKTKYCEEMSQFIVPFFMETPDGSWNGASGLGKDIYSIMATKDRVKCAAMDLVFLRCGITLQAKTENAHNEAGLIQMGATNVIPMNFEVMQSQILGDVESPFAADRYLENTLASNTGVYRTQLDKPQGNPRTAEEVRLQYQTQAILGNSAVNRFYLELDRFGTELFRRASMKDQSNSPAGKLAKEFQKRCEERGVPREVLDKPEYVRAYRTSGNGSLQLRQMNLSNMMTIVPMLSEAGKQNYVEDVVSALNGQAMVERYAPSSEKQKLPNDDMATAMLENAAMKIGAPVSWTPTQNNVIHAQTHLQAAAQAAESLQQGGNPQEVAVFIDAVGQHTAIHLQYLSQDPTRKQEFKILSDQWKQLAQINDQLQAQLKSQAEEQQKQQVKNQEQETQADFERRLDLAQTESKIKLQQAKTDAGIAMKAQKHTQSLALADASTAAKIRMQAASRKSA